MIMLLGSHVGMSGKAMLLGSAKEAVSYGANTFMVYTGAPQNTRSKKIEELRIEDGTKLYERTWNGNVCCSCTIYHQSWRIPTKPETFELAVEFSRS